MPNLPESNLAESGHDLLIDALAIDDLVSRDLPSYSAEEQRLGARIDAPAGSQLQSSPATQAQTDASHG